jgi:Na+-driven multidrug efflux pump
MMLFVPILIFFYTSQFIFQALGQNPEVSHYAYLYIMTYAPGVMLFAFHDLQRKFLIQIGQADV